MADPRGGEPSGNAATEHGTEREFSVIRLRDAPSAEPDSEAADGRSRRRDRNREAVIQAMLELVREGDLSPATADIADRAGVSHRSVFRYFDDVSDLIREAFNVEFAMAVDVATISDIGEGPLAHRIDQVVDTRIHVYEGMFNVSRAARYKAGSIPDLDQALIEVAHLSRAQLRRQFRPELGDRDPAEADEILDAMLVLTDFTPYEIMRRMLGYDEQRIARTWRTALARLLS
jgi:TetR/AcrR family transcriptional regulator, regulator of autoinduction and epiphytic fitness